MSTEVPETERPKRADALRNRDRVLEAARTAFAQGGPDVAVAEILKLAGVGSGTLFRHFATKRDLFIAVLEQTFDQLAAAMDEAEAMEDPWAGLVHVLTTTAEIQARDQGLLQLDITEFLAEDQLRQRNDVMMGKWGDLLRRAQDAGVVREDLAAEDVPFIVGAIAGATQQCVPSAAIRQHKPELWRRYLGIVLDGLRPDGAAALPVPAPSYEEMLALKAESHKRR